MFVRISVYYAYMIFVAWAIQKFIFRNGMKSKVVLRILSNYNRELNRTLKVGLMLRGVFVRFHVELTCYSLGSFILISVLLKFWWKYTFFFVCSRCIMAMVVPSYFYIYYWIIDIIVADVFDYFKQKCFSDFRI